MLLELHALRAHQHAPPAMEVVPQGPPLLNALPVKQTRELIPITNMQTRILAIPHVQVVKLSVQFHRTNVTIAMFPVSHATLHLQTAIAARQDMFLVLDRQERVSLPARLENILAHQLVRTARRGVQFVSEGLLQVEKEFNVHRVTTLTILHLEVHDVLLLALLVNMHIQLTAFAWLVMYRVQHATEHQLIVLLVKQGLCGQLLVQVAVPMHVHQVSICLAQPVSLARLDVNFVMEVPQWADWGPSVLRALVVTFWPLGVPDACLPVRLVRSDLPQTQPAFFAMYRAIRA